MSLTRSLQIAVVLGLLGLTGCTDAAHTDVPLCSLRTQRRRGRHSGRHKHLPNYYRDQAEKLMAQKCPQGYVIDEKRP